MNRNGRPTHGNTRAQTTSHNRSRTPTYQTWRSMKQRCTTNPYYLARNITVCERWNTSFQAFLDDMGERPPGMTIDRIDCNRGYTPDNCRWATWPQQLENKHPWTPRTDSARRLDQKTHCRNGHLLAEVGIQWGERDGQLYPLRCKGCIAEDNQRADRKTYQRHRARARRAAHRSVPTHAVPTVVT